MANEKFYLCNGKTCFTSYNCHKGQLLRGAPARQYLSKEDYINHTNNCVTSVTLHETGERIVFQGDIGWTTEEECPIEKEREECEWNALLKSDEFKKLVTKRDD